MHVRQTKNKQKKFAFKVHLSVIKYINSPLLLSNSVTLSLFLNARGVCILVANCSEEGALGTLHTVQALQTRSLLMYVSDCANRNQTINVR